MSHKFSELDIFEAAFNPVVIHFTFYHQTPTLKLIFYYYYSFKCPFCSCLSWDRRLWGESLPVPSPQQQLHSRPDAPDRQDHGVSLEAYVSFWAIKEESQESNLFKPCSQGQWSHELSTHYSPQPWTGSVVADFIVPQGCFITQVTHSGKQPLNKCLISLWRISVG